MPNIGKHVLGGVRNAALCDCRDTSLYDLVICSDFLSTGDWRGGGMVQPPYILIGVGSRCYGTRCTIVASEKNNGGMVRRYGITIYIVLHAGRSKQNM